MWNFVHRTLHYVTLKTVHNYSSYNSFHPDENYKYFRVKIYHKSWTHNDSSYGEMSKFFMYSNFLKPPLWLASKRYYRIKAEKAQKVLYFPAGTGFWWNLNGISFIKFDQIYTYHIWIFWFNTFRNLSLDIRFLKTSQECNLWIEILLNNINCLTKGRASHMKSA